MPQRYTTYEAPEASGGYFGLAFAMPPQPHIERISALTLQEENYTS